MAYGYGHDASRWDYKSVGLRKTSGSTATAIDVMVVVGFTRPTSAATATSNHESLVT
jgi:hypothetical protein